MEIRMADAGGMYPCLIGDIGGTHARFALVREAGAALELQRTLECARFDGPGSAIGHYLRGVSAPAPESAVLGVATPVADDDVCIVNHPWRFSVESLRRYLKLERLVVINDFEAMAYAIPALDAAAVERIGGGATAMCRRSACCQVRVWRTCIPYCRLDAAPLWSRCGPNRSVPAARRPSARFAAKPCRCSAPCSAPWLRTWP